MRHLSLVAESDGPEGYTVDEIREEKRSGDLSRRTDDIAILETAQRAGAGLSWFWRMGSMLVTLLCAVFILGGQWFAYKGMGEKLAAADVNIQKLQVQVQQLDLNGQLKERDDKHYRDDMEKRQLRDEEFRHSIRAYEFAVIGALREVQGRLNMKTTPLPEIKGDD